jgi:isoleucyl-tRNA synthetase
VKFKKDTRRKALEYEKDLVTYWKENKIFEKSVSMRPEANAYVFYDGPPFITGVPHVGTLYTSMLKDAIPRYWTMRGKRVERVWGWDCHGLPAEVYTEKKLGIKDKREIGTTITLKDYIEACRDNMVQTGNLWEDTIDRIGRWVDFKGAYKTMDKEFMESVWWAFKTLYDKGKIYEGEKVLLYCTHDATPISKAEVAMDNSYQEVTDPSVYVKFKLSDLSGTPRGSNVVFGGIREVTGNPRPTTVKTAYSKVPENTSLLAWTTTPWTLNANTAIVVNKKVLYSLIKLGDEHLIIAKNLLEKVLTNEKHQPLSYEEVGTIEGKDLVGATYEPLFTHRGTNAHKVWHADFVTDEDGTGIAHQAPGYGEDDYLFAKKNKVPFLLDTDEEGFYTEGPWKGKQVWEHNKLIAKDLHQQGVVWKIEYIRHEYPHCHRCQTKLMYRAHPSWFMDIDGQRTEMLEQNGPINWFPEHIKHGRFENTVESAPDWNLSRDRFWATAMPVWKAIDESGKEHIKVVGSYAELKELSGVELDDYHRPYVDDVTFTLNGLQYKRIDKVLDCWFESGSMPFAQFHYPFENVEKFESTFPGDFIVEYMPQVRAWFYYLHVVNVGLFEKPAFKNVIAHGTLAGNDGRKMSKSYGNYTDPNELMDAYSVDALRLFLLGSPMSNGEDVSLIDKDVADVSRKLAMIWNVYDFFTLYAEVDKWESPKVCEDPSALCTSSLDTWIISRIHQLIEEVGRHMETYDVPNALKPILPFVDDLSNWYVRRSRRRFWKSEGSDGDKNNAYTTLHYVLVRLAQVMAPFTPFLSEELYRNLTGEESVHLKDWPDVGHVNELGVEAMEFAKRVVNDGLSIRAKAQLKVRQPLASIKISGVPSSMLINWAEYEAIILDELNIHSAEVVVSSDYAVELDQSITPKLKREGLMREVIRHIQQSRKLAGLDVDDRINISLEATGELAKAIGEHSEVICAEVLADSLQQKLSVEPLHTSSEAIEDMTLRISLAKAP